MAVVRPVVDDELERQLEYLRSDERLRERAARAAEMTVGQRLDLTYRLCRAAMAMLDRQPPEVVARLELLGEPLGPNAEAVLTRLATTARPE